MLQTEITWSDISYILIMITMLVGMYGCYWWGRRDGYYEGCRVRRQSERHVRRLLR